MSAKLFYGSTSPFFAAVGAAFYKTLRYRGEESFDSGQGPADLPALGSRFSDLGENIIGSKFDILALIVRESREGKLLQNLNYRLRGGFVPWRDLLSPITSLVHILVAPS